MKTLLLPITGLAVLGLALCSPKGDAPGTREGRRVQEVETPRVVSLAAPVRRRDAPVAPTRQGFEVDWHDQVRSSDSEERAAAMALVQLCPGADGARVLREAALGDPNDRVRQRAIFALAQVAGREAVPFLREVALGERPLDGAAARAALDLIEELHPRSLRGHVELLSVHEFSPGGVAELVARIHVDDEVRTAQLGWRVPHGWEIIGDALFKGPMSAGETREVRLTLRVPSRPTEGKLVARLKCEFEEQLDFEVARDALLLSVGDGTARAAEPPAGAPRVIDVSDVK